MSPAVAATFHSPSRTIWAEITKAYEKHIFKIRVPFILSIKMVLKFQSPESLNSLSSLGNEQQWGRLFLWSVFHHSSSASHCTWLIYQLSCETARPKQQTRQIHVKSCSFHASMRLFEWNLTFAIFHSDVFSSFLSGQAEQPMEILPPVQQNQHLS